MKTSEANIKITRHGDESITVSVLMPIWIKSEDDGSFLVDIPLLAMKTFAKDENDVEKAANEAVKSFCIAADKFGKGLEAELAFLKWELLEEEEDNLLFNFSSSDDVYGQMMQTGEKYSEKLELA